jgi:uncharacterized membrane protein YfcA
MWDSLIAQFAFHWQFLSVSSTAIFLAAIVRGFSGFGFSLLSITAISILIPPREIVPSIFLLEVAASLNLIPSIWREIDWRGITLLLLGYVVALPVGVYALANVPAPPMQIALGIFVIIIGTVMLNGFRFEKMPSARAVIATGASSGILNGAFGMGGPPVVLFYFSTPAAAAVGRASMIAFILATDSLGLGEVARNGLVTMQSFAQFIVWLPALLIGIAVGANGFKHMDEAKFRHVVLIILIGLAVLTLVKAGYDLARP